MKKSTVLVILLIFSGIFLILSLMNFKNPIAITEGIEENFFVLALGIDKGVEAEGNVRITVTTEKFGGASSDSSSSSQLKEAETITSEGKTIFEASRKFSTFYKKKIFWSHIKYILISEDIAKENILNYLDFCIRGHELRFDSTVAIVKGSTAESVLRLDEKTKEFIPDSLKGIFKDATMLSISENVKMEKIIQMFDNQYEDAYIPSIVIVCKKDKKYEEEKDTYNLELNGFALFNGVKLNGFISQNISRGFNWINGNVKSTIIVIKDKNGNNTSLEVLDSNSKIEVELKDNIPKANIKLEVSSNFSEQMSQEFSYTSEETNFILEKQNELIKAEIESALKYLQENSIDAIGMSDKIYHKYPLEWDNIKSNWKELLVL